jgi:hypothetical protein
VNKGDVEVGNVSSGKQGLDNEARGPQGLVSTCSAAVALASEN